MIDENLKLIRITVDLDAALSQQDLREVSQMAAEMHEIGARSGVELLCEPLYVSDALWQDCVAWNGHGLRIGQDEDGRLWDVVYMAGQAQIAADMAIWNCFPLAYGIYRVSDDGVSVNPTRVSIVTVLASALDGRTAGLCNAPLVVQSVAPSQPPMRKVLVKTMS
ncbi:MAG: hypothetical protein JSR64_10580 [Nitrospira sp.]|nr:hypothetical protein [Nitrospira sp.]